MKRAVAIVIVVAACRSSAPAQEPIENRDDRRGKPATVREPTASRFDWPSDDDDLTPTPGARSSGTAPNVAPACEAHAQRARDFIQKGQHHAAHVAVEQAYACQPHPSFVPLAFMTACTSSNTNNAKRYYALLTPDEQARFAQLCIRQKPPVAYQ